MRKIMASLDIGSTSIKLVVGEMIKNKLNILAFSETYSTGIYKNRILNKEIVINSLKDVFKSCEEKLGFKIKKCIVTVPACSAEFTIGEGIINVENEDYVISGHDITKVLQKSVYGVVQDNMELVTAIPTAFRLDNDVVTLDPRNMISKKLAVKSVIITAYKKDIYPILECLEVIGIDVVDIAFDSLGDYFSFRTKETDQLVGAVVNIGSSKTTVSIFNRGILTNTSLIDLGARNIDNDIAYIYKLDKDKAKELKEKFALANPKLASLSEVIKITNKEQEEVTINQIELSEIVASRLNEILNMVKKQINILTKKEISYIIFTGGITEMPDFNLTLESIYGKKVTLGKINELGVRNNKFSSAVGLIKWYNSNQVLKNRDYSILSIEEQEEFSGIDVIDKITDNSIIGKVFGYFFDN